MGAITMRRAIRDVAPPAWFKSSQWCNVLVVCCALWATVGSQAREPARAENTVKVLGAFSSVRHTGDDALGHVLQLWQEGDHVFGLLMVYTGAPSDPPTGLLEDVKFDPRTRQLSFSARLSTGLVTGRGYSRVPARDRFTFKGVLTRREVNGVLQRSNELFPNDRPTSESIRLRRSASYTELMTPPPTTYAAWKSWADEILKFRGPKW